MEKGFKITLKAARVNANLTIIDAAKKIGIGKDTLIKWEKNPGLVNAMYMSKISEAYSVAVDNIIFLEQN